jgi:hypothetical protein
MNVRVTIDRLVLDGIAVRPSQRPALREAAEAELARLLAEGGVGGQWRQGGAVPQVAAGAVAVPAGDDPALLGRRIAAAVYGGIGT